MPKPGPSAGGDIRAYIAALPPATRREFRKLRSAVKAAVPGGMDAFSYRMPAIRKDNLIVVWYAGFAQHTSLYPMTDAIRKAHGAALKGYKMSTGTVQFPVDKPLPVTLVKKLVKARMAELKARGK